MPRGGHHALSDAQPGTCRGSTSRSRTPPLWRAASRARSARSRVATVCRPARSRLSCSPATAARTTSVCKRLSGAMERGHRFLFVCYDNEAYMNTGVQRSGATPFGASTTTSPAGTESFGKAQTAQGHDGDRRRPPRAVRRPGRREPLARLEPQGLRRRRGRRPVVPQRADRLPSGLGTRAPADAARAATPQSTLASGRSTRSSTAATS